MAAQFINLEYLEIMTDGDQEMKKTMLELFLDEPVSDIKLLNNLFKQNDIVTLAFVSHKLKSTFAFLGNERLSSLIKSINDNAKNNINIEGIQAQINELQDLFSLVLEEVKAELKNIN